MKPRIQCVQTPWIPGFMAPGDPNRRDILRLLSEGDKPVSQIAAALPISRPAVSRHRRRRSVRSARPR
jgi:DNA-binding transcriptional ArsR family regulator